MRLNTSHKVANQLKARKVRQTPFNGFFDSISNILKPRWLLTDGHLASKLDELMPWAYAQPVALKDVA
jgi:hypothetical protein